MRLVTRSSSDRGPELKSEAADHTLFIAQNHKPYQSRGLVSRDPIVRVLPVGGVENSVDLAVMFSERSIPTILPFGPTAFAKAVKLCPVPHHVDHERQTRSSSHSESLIDTLDRVEMR